MADEPVKSLQTPDPLMTTEDIATFVVALVTNLWILFGADHITDEKKTALATVVSSLWVVFVLIHAALLRSGRAKGGGLVAALLPDVLPPAEGGSDVGDQISVSPQSSTPKPIR
jgi:hypothetical protein